MPKPGKEADEEQETKLFVCAYGQEFNKSDVHFTVKSIELSGEISWVALSCPKTAQATRYVRAPPENWKVCLKINGRIMSYPAKLQIL